METDIDDPVVTRLPSLANPDVVGAIVRTFAARVLEIRAAWHRGDAGAADPLSAIEIEARKAGAIILGSDDRYEAPAWNRKTLWAVLTVLFPEETKAYGGPGVALFMWLSAQMCEGAAAVESDQDEEPRVMRRLDATIEDIVARLVRAKY